ncbi:hypothetical protein D9M69_588550 [compost metagenome]
MLLAYSSHIFATFFVTPALSTSTEFSFFKPSVAVTTASDMLRLACRLNAAASFKRLITDTA